MGDDALRHGRQSYRQGAWTDAFLSLARADSSQPLGGDDLARLGTAAYLIGREPDFERAFERAHQAHVATGQPVRAARAAFWLGLGVLLRGDVGLATGWLSRARRLLDDRDCVEQGYLLLPDAEQALAEGGIDSALDAANRAAALGERFGDADLVACARHLQGRALIRQGHIKHGLAALDEAMLAVTAGELSPIVTGLVYCSVIEACQDVYALSRAREWTAALSRWCERQPDLVAFTGTCLVRRAEILQVNGAWPDALTEAVRACERSHDANRNPPAAAFYQRAEIHRLRGEFAAAEDAYRNASGLGCDPHPGLALLWLAQGRTDAACAAIRRVVDGTTDRLARTRLLPACVEILLAAREVEHARNACQELADVADAIGMDTLQAMAAQSRGAVELAEGDARTALRSLRRAFDIWQRVQAPYAAACVRTRMGLACRALGDDETARLEFSAARAAFEHLGAVPDLTRLDALEAPAAAAAHGPHLTIREREVLRLVAAGKTNKAIATELALSERTIDRHVSNILTKLDVPSRAAAAAHACRRNLV